MQHVCLYYGWGFGYVAEVVVSGLHHATPAIFTENLLGGSGTKSNLIFVTVLVGTDYYCHAIVPTGKHS